MENKKIFNPSECIAFPDLRSLMFSSDESIQKVADKLADIYAIFRADFDGDSKSIADMIYSLMRYAEE